MKASELAAEILSMVAQYGDHEIGAGWAFAAGMAGSPIEGVEFCMPSLVDREEGAEPRYLIRWSIWEAQRPD